MKSDSDAKHSALMFSRMFADIIRDQPEDDDFDDEVYEWSNKNGLKNRKCIFGDDVRYEDLKLLVTIPIYGQGRSQDGWAWVVECKGKKQLIMASHGIPYAADATELRDVIARYSEGIQMTVKALIKLGREDVIGAVKGEIVG